MPTPAEIQAAKAVLLDQIGSLPRGEIVRSAEYVTEMILAAAEAARNRKD